MPVRLDLQLPTRQTTSVRRRHGPDLGNDERAYLEEIKHREKWCQGNNLLLNVSKTKQLIVDCSKKERHYQPVRINGTTVERVDSFRYLGVHISQDLSWSRHTNSLAKKARQRLYHLRCLRDFRLPSKVLRNVYTCTIETSSWGTSQSGLGTAPSRTDKHSRGCCVQQSASLIWNFLTCRPSITSSARQGQEDCEGPHPSQHRLFLSV
ncbi:hypothetical protein P4O66_022223 [Electrophorus voltai]|uniref:Alkylated DNA repair protein AlkB homologue 8 N-terminal domain-containing protein n=1 Tax=Electrophorus voltai TaxID=2609070 RepID=A0AAD9E4I5_9TELE|nr:hypothetical protein P4O66_022223 [Electrophorus voltai]